MRDSWYSRGRIGLVAILAIACGATTVRAQAQSAAPQSMTLDAALQYAVDHYPTMTAANVSSAAAPQLQGVLTVTTLKL